MNDRDLIEGLSEEERGLMLELLQMELRDLPVEIHHARRSEVRIDLAHRRDVVQRLVNRLQPQPSTAK